MYMYVCRKIYESVCVGMRVRMQTYLKSMYVWMYASTDVCVHACIYLCIYIYGERDIHKSNKSLVNTHTHTCVNAPPRL